mmetsp:Transcript_30760/g.73268  ORF Transcript_30760/g.73268 Transcript_30760/m.73268 type:complete len:217 (+) Transcript_30760:4-654(+)
MQTRRSIMMTASFVRSDARSRGDLWLFESSFPGGRMDAIASFASWMASASSARSSAHLAVWVAGSGDFRMLRSRSAEPRPNVEVILYLEPWLAHPRLQNATCSTSLVSAGLTMEEKTEWALIDLPLPLFGSLALPSVSSSPAAAPPLPLRFLASARFSASCVASPIWRRRGSQSFARPTARSVASARTSRTSNFHRLSRVRCDDEFSPPLAPSDEL